jgi:hypothetical protein
MSANFQALQYGLEYAPRSMSKWNSFIVPYMTLAELQCAIKQALSSCESITHFEWIPDDFSYIIEYASRPIEETAPFEVLHIIRDKKFVALLAAGDALTRFPHNSPHTDYDLLPIPELKREWSKSKLSIFWDSQNDCLCIEFRRFSGDRVSSIDLCNLIKNHFTQINKIQTDLKNALIEAGVDTDNTNLRDYLVCDVV